jgi:5-methylcytosine-specific restriction endonuclease McrA
MTQTRLCYWCKELLPPLPEDASYVDAINHYAHEECPEERDERNRRMDGLRAGIVEGSIDSIPDVVRQAVLDRIKSSGFSRRCPCLYDPEHGFQGYASHSYSNAEDKVDDYDTRNSVNDCELCDGSGNYDPLPKLLELTDDKAAEAWISGELPRSSGPCDLWSGFPEEGWYYDALGYNRVGKRSVRGVTVYNPERMLGGVISWLEIADLFRPRLQSSLF